jgi:hypothetical protein
MPRQRWLPLGGHASIEKLWAQFPHDSRQQVIELYARLIARACGTIDTCSTKEEAKHGPTTDGSAQQDSL